MAELGHTLGALSYDDLPPAVRERLPVVLADLLGVTAAGMATPELRGLVAAWRPERGPHALIGTDVRTTAETAAMLAAVAACSQELDEGNKYAAGHPAAHVVFAAVAAAQVSGRAVSGRELLTAVAAGYEVAARFGAALRRDARWHPHGSWGATGAACAAAMVLGATPAQVAAAIDASTGLMTVTPWETVLAGDFTRNLWMGQANLAGLNAARLAVAGLAANRGGAAASLAMLGELDPGVLVRELGRRWLCAEGYLKRHAACSYTHAAVDIVQSLRTQRAWSPDEVVHVQVATHSLAAPLLRRDPTSRLAGMFSLPFVVALAATGVEVTPASMEPGTAAFERAQALSARVEVEIRDELDAYLPDRRITEVTVTFDDGESLALAQPNPIGDSAHFPLSEVEAVAKLDALLGASAGGGLLAAVRDLERAEDVTVALERLPLPVG
ncbi:MmgE/PrpD family protein [Nocardioides sp. MAHUQ-72]|uniref:MmgE/PrpD family protein n=1 Tax=unclassified Nocardioides TaxID=2615069 RepID=UPI00361AD435